MLDIATVSTEGSFALDLRNICGHLVGMTLTTLQDHSHSSASSNHANQVDIAKDKFEDLIRRFGFLPQESVVLKWQHDGDELLVQRSDLPVPGNFDKWIEALLEPIDQYAPNGVEVFTHSREDRDSLNEFSSRFTSAVENQGIAIHTFLQIFQSHAYLPECGELCSSHVWTLEAEESLLNSRELLAQTFAYDPTVGISRRIRRDARKNFFPVDRQRRLREIDFIESFLTGGNSLSEKNIARVATGCSDLQVRDVILLSIAHRKLKDIEVAEVLSELLPHLRGRWTAPVATVAAIAWWIYGNGAKANMCIDRAVTEDPSHNLAILVRTALVYGVPASFWIESVSELSGDDCLQGE